MATLILNVGSGSPIPLVVQQANEGAPGEVGTVTQSFNGADRSSVRAIKRNYGSLTTYLDTPTKDSVINLLKNGKQLPCSGDLLANLQTQCTVRYTGARIVQSTSLWEVGLTLSEVQPNNTLLRYSPGDTITGESFTRSTTALQIDANGIYQTAAINAKRDSHFIAGVRTILLEDARTNSLLRSNDLNNAAWTKIGAPTAALNAVGLGGAANTASTVTDPGASASNIQQSVTVPVNSATHCIAYWIRKDSDTTRFPFCYAQIFGGTTVARGAHLNTQTGATVVNNIAGTGTTRVIDAGLWWIVEHTLTNNGSALNTTLAAQIDPARGTVLGTDNAAATGSIIVGDVQIELNASFVSSPIITTAATVTRGADSYSLPFVYPPQEMTAYAKFVEGGTIKGTNGRVFTVSSAADAGPEFLIGPSGGFYQAYHSNGASSVTSTLASAPNLGDTVELVARLFRDASDQITQSVNSAAEVSAAQGISNGLASAWAGQLFWPNSAGTAAAGFGAYQSFKILAGMRTMAEMRAA